MCRTWADKPGLLFSGTTWDTNINEFFVTTLMPLFQTATMAGLLTAGAPLPSVTSQALLLLPHLCVTAVTMSRACLCGSKLCMRCVHALLPCPCCGRLQYHPWPCLLAQQAKLRMQALLAAQPPC